jgi:3-oxoacyl-[acyl-carrier-protein] synthase-3
MATAKICGTRVVGVSSAVPQPIRTVAQAFSVFGEAETLKISASTGVRQRHVVPPGVCTSDLCLAAAERLLQDLNWARDSVDGLIFVSQTPDYILPATSCSLHGRLGLSKHCAAFDLNLGCSGYVYGLWIAAQLVQSGAAHRFLLLVGDTISRIVSPQDRSVALLFGDAGTATAIEKDDTAPPLVFSLGTDGGGQGHLMVPAGGFREPHSAATCHRTSRDDGNTRSDEDLYMNGAEIFTFTLREVPPLFKSVLSTAGWSLEDLDAVVMHQANRFMLEYLAKRMRLAPQKVVIALENRGNTSSASIPLAMTDTLADRLRATSLRLVLAGFGVGFSWAAVALTCGPMVMPELVLVADPSGLPASRGAS